LAAIWAQIDFWELFLLTSSKHSTPGNEESTGYIYVKFVLHEVIKKSEEASSHGTVLGQCDGSNKNTRFVFVVGESLHQDKPHAKRSLGKEFYKHGGCMVCSKQQPQSYYSVIAGQQNRGTAT
jgi:hypothetical protein